VWHNSTTPRRRSSSRTSSSTTCSTTRGQEPLVSALEAAMVTEVEDVLARWRREYAGRPDAEAAHIWLLALERELAARSPLGSRAELADLGASPPARRRRRSRITESEVEWTADFSISEPTNASRRSSRLRGSRDAEHCRGRCRGATSAVRKSSTSLCSQPSRAFTRPERRALIPGAFGVLD
jgi:hypothetical protein